MCKNVSYFTRTNDQASYRHGLELHLVMIQALYTYEIIPLFPAGCVPWRVWGWALGSWPLPSHYCQL